VIYRDLMFIHEQETRKQGRREERLVAEEDVAKQEWIVAEEAVAAQVVATKVKANEEATAKVKDEAEEPTCAATKVNVDAEKVEQKRTAAANAEAHP
jgi:hypothetical protein